MNQDYNLRFNEMKQSDPTIKESGAANNDKVYGSTSHVRNICFIWPDNKKKFLNYSFLVSGDYLPEENSVILNFTTHTIILTGTCLDNLFDDLLQHIPREIICLGERYQHVAEENKPVIREIIVQNKE